VAAEMTFKRKAAQSGKARAAQQIKLQFDSNRIKSLVKTAIVRLALWGVLPTSIADWLIQRGGLRNE
jgi:hypothetical protein